jgi:hypothetical protein
MLGCPSVVKLLPSTLKALDSIPSTEKKTVLTFKKNSGQFYQL